MAAYRNHHIVSIDHGGSIDGLQAIVVHKAGKILEDGLAKIAQIDLYGIKGAISIRGVVLYPFGKHDAMVKEQLGEVGECNMGGREGFEDNSQLLVKVREVVKGIEIHYFFRPIT